MTNLETRLGYTFKNQALLQRALTHKSYANELKNATEHNEKLEFLGDAVLDLVVGEFLFEKFPEDTEGGLSKKRASIVNEEVLSELALDMELNKLMHLGKGETMTGGAQKPRLIASSFEAIVGAMYLDGGFEAAKKFIRSEFTKLTEKVCGTEDFERDYKTRLQELVQKSLKETPRYEVLAEEGPPHDRQFLVCVKIKDDVWAQGRGRSKKNAEQSAAKQALEMKYKETN
ncbi:ribonuclease III [Bdellovibrio bacteriovorus]|uniref:Ribonuclease 3 n=2 Tax=Bdellovibrio bacteriovorus TaxID=959 RepID=A0A150WE68_BDEBC|nr:ribonuclease III [Bdellovibrio bacteriovorus]KYG61286.1 ribonuclease III [Bdellovibrio bacteriovorus]